MAFLVPLPAPTGAGIVAPDFGAFPDHLPRRCHHPAVFSGAALYGCAALLLHSSLQALSLFLRVVGAPRLSPHDLRDELHLDAPQHLDEAFVALALVFQLRVSLAVAT